MGRWGKNVTQANDESCPSEARQGKRNRRQRIGVASALVVAACACAIVFAVAPFGAGSGGSGNNAGNVALPAAQSLADEDAAGVREAGAASFELASVEKFADVLHVEDGTGEQMELQDVPTSDYNGFLFKIAQTSPEAGDVASKMEDAAEEGLVTHVAGDLYKIDSIDALAGLADADEVSLVEPNYTMHLIGDVDGDANTPVEDTHPDDASTPTSASFTDDMAALAASAPDQEAAEQVTTPQTLDTLGGTDSNPAPDYPPNDQNYAAGKLWHLDMLNVKEAWDLGLDGDPFVYNSTPVRDDPVRVAIIDTGLYGTGSTESPHEDFDYSKVDVGFDWIHDTDLQAPDAKGHGTFVAGLIGAKVSNDGIGVAGLMPQVTLVPEKVFDTGSATTDNVISAIYHAAGYYDAADKVDVINMSLGGEYNESTLEEACDYAVSQGILVVASAGNDGVSTPNYPAAYDSVVGVASVDSSKNRSSWSQYGVSVFVTAPGESVTSTYNEGPDSYSTASGTSFSGPEVAALAAMCKSVYPGIDQDTFKQFLIETSDPLDGAQKGEWTQNFGYGLVNFGSMAQTVLASQTLPWYNLSFDVTDEAGKAIEGATVALTAAEDIAWDADSTATPAFEAGSLTAGTSVDPAGSTSEGSTWKVHRGLYGYRVSAPGYYTVTGTLRTMAENQVTPVKMSQAFEVTVKAVDSAGAAVDSATLTVSSATRTEEPKSASGNTAVYDLAAGPYDYRISADGYEEAGGTFLVGHAAKTVNAVLYRAEELRTVSFTFADANDNPITRNVALAVADDSGTVIASQDDATYRLAAGASYTATASKVGYENATVSFTVGDDAQQTIAIKLTSALNRVTFAVRDAESGAAIDTATVKVADKASGAQYDPRASNPRTFDLPQGSYAYELSAPGYESKQGSFDVATSSMQLSVTLTAVPQQVTFAVTDAATGAALEGAVVKVSTASSQRSIPATADQTWLLSPGEYRYTVYKEGYAVAQGSFTVAEGAQTVTVALTAKAAGTTKFAGGSGTEADPYLIANEDQLRYLATSTDIVRMKDPSASSNVRGYVGGFYKLIDDIQLSDEWTPIGNEESDSNYKRFVGTFDGDGHTVSNVRIDQPQLDYQGFFGSVQGATIRNLQVEGPGITGSSYVGGIVGRAYYTYSSEYPDYNTDETTISQCGAQLDVTGRYAVGGIIGSAQATNQDNAGQWVDPGTGGGITISSCYSTGQIAAQVDGAFTKNSSAAGGIAGSAQQIVISACYSTGSVQAGYNAGGIVGNSRLCAITTSYSAGAVSSYITASGYEGRAGGIVGNAYYTLAKTCFALSGTQGTATNYFGATDSASTYTNCLMKAHADMYRSASFVQALNAEGASFRLGRDFPLLTWQAADGALLAATPVVVQQPQGIQATEAYKKGEQARALTAAVKVESSASASSLVTWAWSIADNPQGTGASLVAGATGTGTTATLQPSTDKLGVSYYFCTFTHSLSTESQHDESSAKTQAAAVYVRSIEDALSPVIDKLNPSRSADVNTSVSVKASTLAELTVQAHVDDGGILSYQWYESVSGSASLSPIQGATQPTFEPETKLTGTRYYYVGVMNTLEPGNQATTMSERIAVTVLPYTIDSYEDLIAFRTEVNNGNSFYSASITLTEDIRIPDGQSWQPIGTQEHPFSGTFMGGSGWASSDPDKVRVHTISNMTVDGEACGGAFLGLFGYTLDAQIFDVQVQGRITGAQNTHAGLLVGYASTYDTSSSNAYIENCVALPGSSVEGKYLIGGLVGASGTNMNNCSSHADVQARAFAAEPAPRTDGWWSVGGLVGYAAGTGELMGCYSTGTVTVEAVAAGQDCAEFVGGVAGFTGAHAGLYTSFAAGSVTVGSVVGNPLLERGKVRYAGAVAGYISYGSTRAKNLHYLEGCYSRGTNDGDGADLGDMHSIHFLKTDYFTTMLAKGYAGYAKNHFATSSDGVPHFAWEAENVDASSDHKVHSAEPWLVDVQAADMPRITSSWSGTYYEGGLANPVYVLADCPDGDAGTLTFRWQKRSLSQASAGFDEGWTDIEDTGQTEQKTYAGTTYPFTGTFTAGMFTIPHDSTDDSAQYRCVVTNKRQGAQDAEAMESATNPITIQVKPREQGIYLLDQARPNSSTNPWIIDSPVRMKLFADVVNGSELLPGLSDSTFAKQYVALDADIDLSSYENWQPIGTYGEASRTSCFQGTFDGRNHKVSGLHIDRQGDAVLSGSTWYSEDYTGVGLFGGVYLASIKNLDVSGSVYLDNGRYTSTTNNAWMTGGVVGYAWGSFIENVTNRASVTGYEEAGGVVGRAENCRILNCENRGAVGVNPSALKSQYKGICIGGVVGKTLDTMNGQVAGVGCFNCFDAGTVTGRVTSDGDYRFGAVVGEWSSGDVANCYYLKGAAVVAPSGGVAATQVPTGIGGGNNARKPRADEEGIAQVVDDASRMPETAWLLNTSGVENLGFPLGHSARWGCFAQADGAAGDSVALVHGDASKTMYRLDTASEAVDIHATPAYATPGTLVEVQWACKRGFTMSSISWRPATDASASATELGRTEQGSSQLAMPSSDVSFVVQAERDTTHRYSLTSRVLLDGKAAQAKVGSVTFAQNDVFANTTVRATIACGSGYQVKAVSAKDEYGVAVATTKVDGLRYDIAVAAANVVLSVEFEPVGAVAAAQARSLAVDYEAVHRYTSDDSRATDNMLFQTIAFSGKYYGSEKPYMTYELEGFSNPGLYTQTYTFSDGSSHTYTGLEVGGVLSALGNGVVPADTVVTFECLDGSAHRFLYSELTSLAYSSYDRTGQPDVRGLPVLLYFGADSKPNAEGACVGLVFGQRSASDANAARSFAGISRICVGDDVNYSMHEWSYTSGKRTVDYANMDQISGGVTDGEMGQSTLHVRVYRGDKKTGELVKDSAITLPQIETMARGDRAGVQRGFYSTYLYEDQTVITDGPYTDYYEGYDLYKVLQKCGVPYFANSTVQFYQTGLNGLENSWETVDVSLDYVAGNGPNGVGDYSGNFMKYAGDGYVSKGVLTGVRPMIVYGKNGYPLVWGSGTDGVQADGYNYRGPLMAFLPQNATEGGDHVGSATCTSCYLGLIDVYLPQDASIAAIDLASAVAEAEYALSSGVVESADGSDVLAGDRWVPTAQVKALRQAIDKAKAVYDDPNATEAERTRATESLRAAVAAFNAAVRTGVLSSGGYAANGQLRSTSLPVAVKGLVYDGARHVGVPSGAGYVLSGETSAIAAGTHVAYAVPATGYVWTDGTSGKKAISWSIARAKVSRPSARTGLVYNRAKQTGVASGTGYVVSNGTATNAGVYTATAWPDSNHQWSDGSTARIGITYSIAKAATKLSVSRTSYSLKFGARAFSLGAKSTGDGAISYKSSKPSVAAVSGAGKVSVKGVGSAKVTVLAAEGKNYRAASASVTVKAKKAANTLKVTKAKSKAKVVKYKKLKRAKQKVKVLKVKGAKGKVTYSITKIGAKKYKKSPWKKRFKMTKAGKLTVAKGTPKGTYKITIKVKAAGTKNYKAKSVKKTVKVKVK